MPNPFILPPLPDLPIIAALPELRAALAAHRRVVLEAPPGAGKTTVVPLALLAAEWRHPDDKILVLEPRQLAVRGAAARLAQLLGEPVGRTIGYRVRLDSKVSKDTRVEVITEGILTRMIQDDPALEGVAAVVFDEFHERSLNADLGLALALDAQAVLRDDLRILIMSATLEAQRLGQWLPAPVVSSAGFLFPIDTHYLDPRRAALPNKPNERLAELVPAQVKAALNAHPEGDILVFLPGVGDLQRSARKLQDSLPDHVDLHLLHGELPLETQDAALRPVGGGRRKVILATSIAETRRLRTSAALRAAYRLHHPRNRTRGPRRRRPAPGPRRPPGPRHLLPPLDRSRAPQHARPSPPRNPHRRPQQPRPGAGPVGRGHTYRPALARCAARCRVRPGAGAAGAAGRFGRE
jgi:ATP-dependent helicase HrpB